MRGDSRGQGFREHLAGLLCRATRAAALSQLTCAAMSCLANTSRTDWACSGGSAASGVVGGREAGGEGAAARMTHVLHGSSLKS